MLISRKQIWKTAFLYLLVIVVVNGIGAFLPAEFTLPFIDSESLRNWENYQNTHGKNMALLYSMNYLVTIGLCLIYVTPKDKRKIPSRFINMPFRFAGIGCLGWLVFIINETLFVYFHRTELNIKVSSIFIDDLTFSVIMAFFCFTIAYFTLENIHRNVFLPRYFPRGNLNDFPVRKKATMILKVRNFYIASAFSPCFYLFCKYTSLANENGHALDKDTIIVLSVFAVFGIGLLILAIRYLRIPLEKLEKGAETIKNGDYTQKIDFISNDDFGDLSDAFNDMTEALQKKNVRIAAIQDSIIKGMGLMVESRDVNTGGHISRTSDCVKVFVDKLRHHPDYDFISGHYYDSLIKAAPMHDLGKIAVDDAVLRKPGKFTPEEYEIMKSHSAAGAKIVEQVIREVEDKEFKTIAINVAHYHHEKWNGEGYPLGLKGEQIPLEARIMALADVFDALVSKRCYKDSFTYHKAFSIIEDSLGTHFDPYLGLQFLSCRRELEELYSKYEEKKE